MRLEYDYMRRNGEEWYRKYRDVTFQVLTAASMKMTAFWDVAPRSLVEVDRRLRGAYCLHQGDETSETSVYFYETTRRYIPESCHLPDVRLLPWLLLKQTGTLHRRSVNVTSCL
jgi:hypothetical protein